MALSPLCSARIPTSLVSAPPPLLPQDKAFQAIDISFIDSASFKKLSKEQYIFSIQAQDTPLKLCSASETLSLASVVPPLLHDYLNIFFKKSADELPHHAPYNHVITLQPGTSPLFGPIYSLSEVELKALKEYL